MKKLFTWKDEQENENKILLTTNDLDKYDKVTEDDLITAVYKIYACANLTETPKPIKDNYLGLLYFDGLLNNYAIRTNKFEKSNEIFTYSTLSDDFEQAIVNIINEIIVATKENISSH